MRWKLMFIAALVAGIAGTGLTLALIRAFFISAHPLNAYDSVALGTLLIPLIAIMLASIFVYRHSARRRKLQALITAAIALLFTLTLFMLGSAFFSKQTPAPPSSAPPRITS